MKKSELIEGEVYSVNDNNAKFIVKHGCRNIYICVKTPYSKPFLSEGFSHDGFYDYTPATPDQIKHLNACIEANKFIPFDEIPKETNLEKAKKLYPKGTKFKSVVTGLIYTSHGSFIIEKDNEDIACANGGWILGDGKWAEIISTPESDPLNEFIKAVSEEKINESIKSAIELLKSNGYKVLEKVEDWKEI